MLQVLWITVLRIENTPEILSTWSIVLYLEHLWCSFKKLNILHHERDTVPGECRHES